MSEGKINLMAINKFVSKWVLIDMVNIQVEKNTAGPWITSFCYKVDEGKKNQLLAMSTVHVEFTLSSHICVGFLWGLRFPLISQRYAH